MARHHEGRLGPRSSGSQGRGVHRAGRIESQRKPPLAKINSERDNPLTAPRQPNLWCPSRQGRPGSRGPGSRSQRSSDHRTGTGSPRVDRLIKITFRNPGRPRVHRTGTPNRLNRRRASPASGPNRPRRAGVLRRWSVGPSTLKEVIDLQAPPLSDGMGSGAASGAGEPAWVTEDVPQDLSDPIGAHDEPEEPS